MGRSTLNNGVPDLLIASLIWGTIGIITEIGYEYGANSFATVLVRSAVASIFSLLVVGKNSLSPTKENLIMGGISTTFYEVYVFTIEKIGAPLSAVFLYMAPMFVVILSKVFTKDRITLNKVIASVMVFVGVYLIYLSNVTFLDLSLGIASGFSYALLILFSRFMQNKGTSDIEILSSQSIWGFPMTLVISFLFSPIISVSSTLTGLYLGLVATVIAYIFFYRGMRKTDSIIASIVTSMEPVFTVILSWLILNEILTPLQVLGFIVIMTSSFIALR